MDFSKLKEKLKEAGVAFESGLTQEEVQLVEASFGFQFPPDLKSFLMFALPRGKGWPNWRDVEDPEIRRMLNWPYEGICFDIQYNAFWPVSWGAKPGSLTEGFKVAKRKVDAVPKLIPIFSHRYLPDRPSLEGNPELCLKSRRSLLDRVSTGSGSDLVLPIFLNKFLTLLVRPGRYRSLY